MSNADRTFAWKILAGGLRSEINQLQSNDYEITRLTARQTEIRNRITYLEEAIRQLGGDLDEARKP